MGKMYTEIEAKQKQQSAKNPPKAPLKRCG